MIHVKDVTIKTRETLFSNLSVTFQKGTITSIEAPNGTGKTTLFRVLAGLLPATQGVVEYDRLSNGEKALLFYYETSEWFERDLSGYDYLSFVKKMWQSDKEVEEMVSFWEMGEYIKIPIKKYSLGMKQKLLLSVYYLSNADVWFLDEPMNGLDESSRTKFYHLLEQEKEGKTILITSHYIEELQKLSDVSYKINNRTLEEIS